MPSPKPLENYTSYKGLPQLAGLCTVEEAAKPGLSVEECVRRLKRFHYAFKRLHEILVARITAEPIYELKTAFSHHAYLCAEHVQALRTRIAEMREPPLGLEDVPHPASGGRESPETTQAQPGAPRSLGGLTSPARQDAALPRRYSKTPYQYDPVPKRDERFQDVWNQGVNAESFLYNEVFPARAKA